MCGHFGLHRPTAALTFTELNVMYNMMLAGVVRGMDGTGIVAVDKDGANLRAIKTAGAPWQLFGSGIWQTFKTSMDKDAATIIGHHRAATKGGVTGANAHPFTRGHITMAHNGTLTNNFPLEFSVDSDWLTSEVAAKGVKAFADIHGAYACVWWDDNEKSLNFFANKERPFSIVEYDKTFFWASEIAMMDWILPRQFKTFDPKRYTLYELKEDTHYILDGKSSVLMEGETVIKNPKPKTTTYYHYTKGTKDSDGPYGRKVKHLPKIRGKNKKGGQANDDMFCVFSLIEETTFPGGRYKYSGITDRHELMSIVTDWKIPNWDTDAFEGMLQSPPQTIMRDGKQFVEYQIEKNSYWKLEPVDVTDLKEPDKKLYLGCGSEVTKSELVSLVLDNCAVCDSMMHQDFHGEYLAIRTGINKTVHGLICQACQEEFVGTVTEDA